MFSHSWPKFLDWLKRSPRRPSRRRPALPRRLIRPLLEFLEDRIVPSIDVWTGASPNTNNWSDPLNWSLKQVPGMTDTAEFTKTGVVNYQVNVDPPSPIAALTIDSSWGINGGTLYINGALTVTGNFELDSGSFIEQTGSVSIGGSNSVWTGGVIDLAPGGFLNTGTFNIDTGNPNNRVLTVQNGASAGTLTNSGTINLSGADYLDIRAGDTLNNTGTIDFTSDANVEELFGGVLTNSGTIEKTGGTVGGTSSIISSFNNNNGVLDAAFGTLAIAGTSSLLNGGTLEASSGATLSLVGGDVTVDYAGTFTGSGAGTVALTRGTLAVTSAGATFNLPGSLFQWTGGTIDVSSGGTLTNASTGVLNLNATNITLTGAGALTNQGTINAAGVSNLTLTNSATLHNASGATFDFTGDSAVVTDGGHSGGPFTNDGLLEKTGGTGASTIGSAFNNDGAAITVTTGTVAVNSPSGLINGGTFTVSAGATLKLAGNVNAVDYAGTFTGSGAGTVALTRGTLAVTSAGATFNLPGSLFQWTGGTIDVSSGGTLTNADTITIAGNQNVTLIGAGSLINNKIINETSTAYLILANNATLNNTSKGTYNIAGNGGIAVSGTVSLVNAGTLRKSSGTGTSSIQVPLNNTGTVTVSSGTLNISGTVTQISSNTLTGGTWIVKHSAKSNSTLHISSVGTLTTIGSTAKVELSGSNTTLTNLSGLNTILAGGVFTLAGGAAFSTPGALTNNGSMTLSPGSVLTVNGAFTETSTGKVTVQIGGTNSSPRFGGIVSTGPVSLGGSLKVSSTVTPAANSSASTFEILNNENAAAISGAFAGLPEGSTFTVTVGTTTMTFQITYKGGDGNDVVITRIA